jgi:histidinol-phosphate aminotransferase
MGLLDYYRQFEGMTEEEVNQGLREQAAERRRKALTRVDTLDLSLTTWPELPHPRIAGAITFVARRGLHRYPHLGSSDLRAALAERHGVDPERLILGNGAAELLTAATRAVIEPGQRLLTRWPSYPLYPIMARRAHGQAVRVDGGVDGGVDALLEAAARTHSSTLHAGGHPEGHRQAGEPDVRAIAIAAPNDPTGELLAASELRRLLEQLPEGVAVLLDESLVEFVDAQPINSSIDLLERHPRLLVFRSFSKAWGLAGLRVGYAIGGPGSEELLAELAPDLGVSEISQAGAFEALRSCSELVDARVRAVCRERPRLTAGLRALGFEVADSQANFVWAAHPSILAADLAARLERAGVLVAPGDALGEPRHVRIAVYSAAATDRVLGAIEKAL